MNEFQFEKLIREAAHKEKTNIPEDFNIMLKDTLNKLPEKEARKDGASGRMAGLGYLPQRRLPPCCLCCCQM